MFKTHFQASLSDNNRMEKLAIRTSQKCAVKIAFWREFGEKNALWGELRREQRGEKSPSNTIELHGLAMPLTE